MVFQTPNGHNNRNLIKKVICDTIVCDTINGTPLILNLITSSLIDKYRRDKSICNYEPEIRQVLIGDMLKCGLTGYI